MNNSTPAGSWFLEAEGSRLEMTISQIQNRYTGVITYDDGYSELISNISWDPQSCSLEFWWDSVRQWCRAYVMDDAPSKPAATPVRPTSASAPAETAETADHNAALYELAAALAPIFTAPPRGAGAKFGNLLFSLSEVGPCCPLDGDMRRKGLDQEAYDGEAGARTRESGDFRAPYRSRRCA